MKEETSHIRNRGIASSSLRGETTFGRAKRSQWVGLLLILLFLSCSTDNDADITPPATDTRQTAYLQVGMGGASTYAPVFNADEFKLESVAFFVVTAGGEFSKYLSTETLNSDRGLSTALSASAGSYTTSLTIRANDLSGMSQIIVIGNYAENGLTDKLLSVNTLDDLQNLQSNAIADNSAMPPLPLLMYASKSLDLTAVSSVAFNDTQSKLKRMAARIDVLGNDTEYFEFYSAQVLLPKPATYLLPNNTTTNIAAITPLVDFAPSTTVIASPTDKRISLYTYECGESDLPVVQVVYRSVEDPSKKYSRDIPYPITTQLGNPITSIVRNTYYEVHTTPPPVAVFDVDYGDGWDEEDEIWLAVP